MGGSMEVDKRNRRLAV